MSRRSPRSAKCSSDGYSTNAGMRSTMAPAKRRSAREAWRNLGRPHASAHASTRHANPAMTVGHIGTVEGAAPITRGNAPIVTMGVARHRNAQTAADPLRAILHGNDVT